MAQPPPCCAVLQMRTQDTGWRGVLEPLGWPRGRSFPDATLSGVAHRDCLMVGHVSGLGCPLAAPHSWGHLEASEKGGGMAGLPACVLPAGQTPPSTGTCSHTQIRSPLSSPTLCPETPIITGLQPPTQVLTPTPTLSPHMSFQTHRYTHPCKDTSYSFPLQGRVRGAAPGILPVSPLPPSTLYMSILLAPAS